MVSAFPFSALFPLGTLVAEIGVIVVGAYYWVGWRSLNKISATRALSELPFPLAKPPWPELRYLRWGIFLSVAIFMVAGAADAVGDWLFMLAGSLLGFCAALFFAMLGVGFVALFHLWKELVPQFRRANIWSLLLSSPLAIFWLALGLVVMVFLGMIIEKVPVFGQFVFFKALIWGVISIALYRLWMGRSHAALVLRAILMVSFSGIIVGAVAYAYWWIIAQTALFLIVCLSTIGALNVAFYSSSVRLTALKDNLIEPPGA